MHCIRCGLLLQTEQRGRSVCLSVYLSLCLLFTLVSPVKTAKPIEMPFDGLTHVGQGNYALDGGQGRTNPFASARGTRRRCGLLSKFFNDLLKFVVT